MWRTNGRRKRKSKPESFSTLLNDLQRPFKKKEKLENKIITLGGLGIMVWSLYFFEKKCIKLAMQLQQVIDFI